MHIHMGIEYLYTYEMHSFKGKLFMCSWNNAMGMTISNVHEYFGTFDSIKTRQVFQTLCYVLASILKNPSVYPHWYMAPSFLTSENMLILNNQKIPLEALTNSVKSSRGLFAPWSVIIFQIKHNLFDIYRFSISKLTRISRRMRGRTK